MIVEATTRCLKAHEPPRLQIEIAPSERDPENAEAAMLLLGIAVPDAGRGVSRDVGPPVQLEPWVVQAALSRRRGGQGLTEGEVSEIKRCTRVCRHPALAPEAARVSRQRLDGEGDIGYRKPPVATRFRKGESGNPGGRPRGRRRLPYEAVLGQMVTIREDGRVRRVTAAEAFLLQLDQARPGGRRRSHPLCPGSDRRETGCPAGEPRASARSSLSVSLRAGVNIALEPLRMARKLDRYRETARMALGALDRGSGPGSARQSAANSRGAGDGRPGHADAEQRCVGRTGGR